MRLLNAPPVWPWALLGRMHPQLHWAACCSGPPAWGSRWLTSQACQGASELASIPSSLLNEAWCHSGNSEGCTQSHSLCHYKDTEDVIKIQKDTTCYWSSFGCRAIDCNSLDVTTQPISYPSNGLSIKLIIHQLFHKDFAWDFIKCLTELQVDDFNCSSFIHQYCHTIVGSHQD